MSAQITRTITTWNAKAYKIAWKNGKPEAALIGEADYIGSDSKTEARAALKAANVACPRGTEIVIEKKSEALYAMPLDEFIAAAHLVVRGVK